MLHCRDLSCFSKSLQALVKYTFIFCVAEKPVSQQTAQIWSLSGDDVLDDDIVSGTVTYMTFVSSLALSVNYDKTNNL